MRHLIAALAALAFLLANGIGTAHAAMQWTGPGSNGHWYEVVNVGPGGINWDTARTAAPSVLPGGYLATSTSLAENDFIYSLVSSDSTLWYIDPYGNGIGPWLGGYQVQGSPEPGGGWTWITGETWGYTNWAPGEPNDMGGTEDYLHLLGSQRLMGSTWNDLSFDVPVRGYVVESPVPEPSAFGLLGAAAVGLLFWTRRRTSKA